MDRLFIDFENEYIDWTLLNQKIHKSAPGISNKKQDFVTTIGVNIASNLFVSAIIDFNFGNIIFEKENRRYTLINPALEKNKAEILCSLGLEELAVPAVQTTS